MLEMVTKPMTMTMTMTMIPPLSLTLLTHLPPLPMKPLILPHGPIILAPLKRPQHVPPPPPIHPPPVVVLLRPPVVQEDVRARGAAEDLAPGKEHVAAGEGRLRGGLVAPVVHAGIIKKTTEQEERWSGNGKENVG